MTLFESLQQRDVIFRNRIVVAPMCQYSAIDGMPDEWHLVHLGSRAVGGAGAVVSEATAVSPEGRISAGDVGIWNDAQVASWRRIADFVRRQGAVPGVQLAHAGRKASVHAPWLGGGPLSEAEGAWATVAPSAVPFDGDWHVPVAMDDAAIAKVVADFRAAAVRARDAGFDLVELHAAHGYLLHQFLSPLSNRRDDAFGGDFAGRTRLLLDVVRAVREVWPSHLPLWVRISATDWADGGWTPDESVELARRLKPLGVDLVDTSSGGLVPRVKIPLAPGYQVPFATRIRTEADIAVGAVGLITSPEHAEAIVREGHADMVLIARENLRDPYFPRTAAAALGVSVDAPKQYARAW
ncbi:2,4-dienoyl-CoA reductase-like NADH-dependent reductase (Old Yellow Enzyme family) [Luteibacter rhizovicinus]|uniref:2,4-dienoyl-CoA reductase-like NADH-dependent reductase (Old Yellow Enzyme family) n=1 Tax=Luteibacter rhizovicinus TaxID=242606 RepID=A0A4R3Z0H3_9GAMM|nr:NADH:flavin oxidoreductase/NADH oxidase [Luteibacter rhizovicinus]TCV97193.1 2,4-dienoyl-CoA reductase-like NADH-dependent reductase (Old Yellow Enzyme family) [Luteibacter rhizovicinus]